MVCDSYDNPHKVYMWDLEANTAFVVATFAEANWPSPETGRRGLHPHFTPDGLLHCPALHCPVLHFIALPCTAHCTALHCTALHCRFMCSLRFVDCPFTSHACQLQLGVPGRCSNHCAGCCDLGKSQSLRPMLKAHSSIACSLMYVS